MAVNRDENKQVFKASSDGSRWKTANAVLQALAAFVVVIGGLAAAWAYFWPFLALGN